MRLNKILAGFHVGLLAGATLLGPALVLAQTKPGPAFKALVFSKTTGFRHSSIPNGIAAIRAVAAETGFIADATEDADQFTDVTLSQYKVVVFLNTTGDLFNPLQRAAFERFIAAGGGYAGIHSASDTEHAWPWYGGLVGAYFKSHPEIQNATLRIEDGNHPSTHHLPWRWTRRDEWYNFSASPRGAVHVLAAVEEASYSGGTMGADHPIIWCHEYAGGRSWYTALGHTEESYDDPLFRLHILGGIQSAAGVVQSRCR